MDQWLLATTHTITRNEAYGKKRKQEHTQPEVREMFIRQVHKRLSWHCREIEYMAHAESMREIVLATTPHDAQDRQRRIASPACTSKLDNCHHLTLQPLLCSKHAVQPPSTPLDLVTTVRFDLNMTKMKRLR